MADIQEVPIDAQDIPEMAQDIQNIPETETCQVLEQQIQSYFPYFLIPLDS